MGQYREHRKGNLEKEVVLVFTLIAQVLAGALVAVLAVIALAALLLMIAIT